MCAARGLPLPLTLPLTLAALAAQDGLLLAHGACPSFVGRKLDEVIQANKPRPRLPDTPRRWAAAVRVSVVLL